MKEKIIIVMLGAGAWGGTLGRLLSEKGIPVILWQPLKEEYGKIRKFNSIFAYSPYLYKIPLGKNIKIFCDLSDVFSEAFAFTGKKIIVYAVPSRCVKEISNKILPYVKQDNKIQFLSVVKGIETTSMQTMTELICSIIPAAANKIAVLSGPSFAVEVFNKKPTAVVVASKNNVYAHLIQNIFTNGYFRVYTTNDVKGVELGGSLKNVFAIACGIIDGLGMGDNAKSALITRGLREFVKIGASLSGKRETFFGLSGLGDLITTCFSKNSRNRLFGELISKGFKPDDALKKIKSSVEGYPTAFAAYKIGRKKQLDLPIINETYKIIYKGKNPYQAVTDLMGRTVKGETE